MALSTPLIAMLLTVLLTPLLMRWAPVAGLLAQPAARKVHGMPTPEVGGIAMFIGALLPCLLWLPVSDGTLAALCSVSLVTLLGACDDKFDLHYGVKFLVQFVAAAVVAHSGFALISNIGVAGWGSGLALGVAVPLTMVALVGIANAVNFSDGLDGLAGGTMLLTGAVLAFLAHRAQDLPLLIATLAVLGALVGFLRFNTYPARVFMGDSGAYFLGFALAIVAIRLGQGLYAPALPLLLFGLQLFDALMVSCERMLTGQSPFKAGRNHTHHKLLGLGLQHYQAVVVTYVIAAVFVGCGYLMRFSSTAVILLGFVGIGGVLVLVYSIAVIWSNGSGTRAPDRLARWLTSEPTEGVAKGRRLRGFAVMAAVLPSYVLWTVCSVAARWLGTAPEVILRAALLGVLAVLVGAGGVLLALWLRNARPTWRLWIERGLLYLGASSIAYLGYESGLAASLADQLLVGVLTTAVLLALGLARSSFPLTPMDALLALSLLLFPNLPGLNVDLSISISFAKLVVLFYGVELLLSQRSLFREALHWSMTRRARSPQRPLRSRSDAAAYESKHV